MMSCQQHDYLEIACLYNLPIKLYLKSGATYKGAAIDTRWNANREECMVISVENEQISIALDAICKMEALTKNRHFDVITFDQTI